MSYQRTKCGFLNPLPSTKFKVQRSYIGCKPIRTVSPWNGVGCVGRLPDGASTTQLFSSLSPSEIYGKELVSGISPFLPKEYFIRSTSQVLFCVVILRTLQGLFEWTIARMSTSSSPDRTKETDKDKQLLFSQKKKSKRWKGTAIQSVHTFANIGFALAGTASVFKGRPSFFIPWRSNDLHSALSRIGGHENLAYFAIYQTGYTMWSLFFDVFQNRAVATEDSKHSSFKYTHDDVMAMHHIFTIWSGFTASVATLGGRYYIPFFFGLIEYSSIFLSIITILEKHQRKWIRKFPAFHMTCKILFALSFLTIRIILWSLVLVPMSLDVGILFFSAPTKLSVWLPALALIQGFLLTLMQIYWGVLILQTSKKIVRGKKTKVATDS